MQITLLRLAIAATAMPVSAMTPALADAIRPPAILTASDETPVNLFGVSADISGDTAIVGATGYDGVGGANQGAAYIYRRTATGWIEEAKLTASDGGAGDQFGVSVSIDGDWAIVGAWEHDGSLGSNQGAAYVFRRTGSTWTEEIKLTGQDVSERFGASVAIDGEWAIVGATLSNLAGVTDGGAAYVFRWTGVAWGFFAPLTAADAAAFDQLGNSVAVSGDSVVVGASLDDGPAGSNQGAAYVFTWDGFFWTQQTKLTASDAASNDRFGNSVAIDGDDAIVGATLAHGDAGNDQGKAYAFRRSGSSWSEQAKLTASDAAAGDHFGRSVAIDGDTALVGAHLNDSPAGYDQGAAYLFTRSGSSWAEQAKLTAPDAETLAYFGNAVALSGQSAIVSNNAQFNGAFQSVAGAAYAFDLTGCGPVRITASDAASFDEFGRAVAISGDTAIVGAYADDGALANQGSAYFVRWNGLGWAEEAKVVSSSPLAGGFFGFSVDIDGDTAVVGAYPENAAYVFVRTGSSWTQQARLTAADAVLNDQFGIAVAIDGDTAVIGSRLDDDAGSGSGSVYVFVRSGSSWSQQAKFTAADGASNDNFGFSVDLSGDTVIIGAYLDDDTAGTDQGSAYIFTRSGSNWTQQAKLTADDAAAVDLFGYSVGLSGDTAIVGAYRDDDAGTDSGSAYIFTRSGSSWTQQAKLTAEDGAAIDFFGISVALAGDTAIVGATLADGSAGTNQGKAYTFTRSGSSWTMQLRLAPSVAGAADEFGVAVAIDGDTAIVGASKQDGDAGSNQGAAFVFERVTPPAWADVRQISSQTSFVLAQSVDVDGDTLVIGAASDSVDGPATGSAFVYERIGGGWVYQTRLSRAMVLGAGLAFEGFGDAVAIDRDTIVVGTNGGSDAYVFVRTPAGWIGDGSLSAGGPATAVAVSGDTIAVGVPAFDGERGVVRVFERIGGAFTETAQIPGPGPTARFGQDVSLDGDTLAFIMGEAGVFAYVHTRQPFGWPQSAVIDNIFGARAVDLSGGALAIGDLLDVRVYTEAAGVWTLEQSIPVVSDDVALDGDTLVVIEADVDLAPLGVFDRAAIYRRADGRWTRAGSSDDSAGAQRRRAAISADVAAWTAPNRETAPGVFGAVLVGSNGVWSCRFDTTVSATAGAQAWPSLASAVAGAAAPDTLRAAFPAFHAMGVVDFAGKALDIQADAEIRQAWPGDLTLAGGASLATPSNRDAIFYGALRIPAGAAATIDSDAVRLGAGATFEAGVGAVVSITGDLDVAISDPARFAADGAEILVPGDVSVALEALAGPLGGTRAGEVFRVGTLRISAGGSVTVVDEHDNDPAGAGRESIIVGDLVIEAGASLITNGALVYYDTLTNNGIVDDPGNLIPANPCIADRNGDTQVDGADLGLLLGAWGALGGDLNGDGVTDGADLGLLLGAWGACP